MTTRSGIRRAGRVWTSVIALAALLLVTTSEAQADTDRQQIDARFRLQWPVDDAAQHWARIEVIDSDSSISTSSISEIENHSRSPFATGAYQLSDDGHTLLFRPRGPIKDGCVEFRVQASHEAQLDIRLVDRSSLPRTDRHFESESAANATVKLSQALDGQTIQAPTVQNSSWTLRRVKNDGLRIELEGQTFLIDPTAESELTCHLAGRSLVGLANQSERLHATIYRAGDHSVVASNVWDTTIDEDGNFQQVTWRQDIPTVPGVYEIRCELKQPESRIWSRLGKRSEVSAVATHPFVVLPPVTKTSGSDAREWREIALFRPSEQDRSGWSHWMPTNTSRLNPLATTSPEEDFPQGEHAGQVTSIIQRDKPYETTLPTLVPGQPQTVTIRYPGERLARLRVEVIHADGHSSPDFVLAQENAVMTGRDWAEHTFAYYPGAGDTRIRVSNLSSKSNAMVESISVYAGPSQLASTGTDVPTDVTSQERLVTYALSDFDWADAFTSDMDLTTLAKRYDPRTVSLHQLMIATERLKDYLRASGMNAVVVPAIVGNRAAYGTARFRPSQTESRVDQSRLNLVMRLLESSQLRVFAGIETSATLSDLENWIFEHPDQLTRVTSKTKNVPNYSPIHPATQAAVLSLISELDSELQPFDRYSGISIRCDSKSHVSPALPPVDQAGQTVDQAGQTNEQIAAKLSRFFRHMMNHVDGLTMLRFATETDRSSINLPQLESSDEGGSESLTLAANNRKLVVLYDARRGPVGALPLQLRLDQSVKISTKELRRIDSDHGVGHGYCITDAMIAKAPKRAAYDTVPQPALRDRTTNDVTRILERSDPMCLMFDGVNATMTVNSELADLLRDWSALPTEGISEVQPPDPTAATARIRFGRHDGVYHLIAINLAPWQSDVTIQTSRALDWQRSGESGTVAENASRPGNIYRNEGLRTKIRLQPRSLIVLRADDAQPGVAVLDWIASVHGGKQSLDGIAAQVTKIVDRLGGLADPPTYASLSNGGFESDSSVGVTGWLHAQHPPDAVRIDDTESIEGKRSVRLTTDQNVGDRTWLVSEMIQPPRTGRLGVSLACRAELADDNSTHRLRVSIEGNRAGEPIRQSTEIQIPSNGQWRPTQLVLEVDGVDPSSVDMLRLTIDSLSRGRVWVDDVRLHDWFPLSKERGELQGEAYVAVQGLQRGNLTPAARLIQNEWAQQLLASEAPAPPAVIEAAPPADAPAGVAERIRSWLPTPLRF